MGRNIDVRITLAALHLIEPPRVYPHPRNDENTLPNKLLEARQKCTNKTRQTRRVIHTKTTAWTGRPRGHLDRARNLPNWALQRSKGRICPSGEEKKQQLDLKIPGVGN